MNADTHLDMSAHDAAHRPFRDSSHPRETTAWDVYNNEARKVDHELVKDWMASLNSLLLFASIFAAVLSAFIIESKKMLEPDYPAMTLGLMIFVANNLANGTRATYTPDPFQPSSSAVSVNCLLFASLGASLVAALASVVALQWVADYDAAITRGGSSPEDRAKRRHFRFAGVEKWKMSGIIAALPLLLYFAVVLFFTGVIQWMFLVNTAVGYVVTVSAVIVGLFYFMSTLVSVVFVSAPFRSPITQWIYLSYSLFCAFIHWVTITLLARNVPTWIDRGRLG
ncbi:hypothetical protein M408DRAFT_235356, partial [Serendipita vermifera MAFF 305830]